jgi:DNA-binding CsgD family transcriptional regulator
VGVLLERDVFVSTLRGYIDEAARGEGRLVLLCGEAGVGKTELLEYVRGGAPEARWLWSACDALSTPRPLAPLHDIARQVGGPLLDAVRAGKGRDELFDLALATLADAERLVVMVVEDVHWADEAMLDLLRFLWPRLRDLRAILIVSLRDDAVSNDQLQLMLGDAASFRGTRRMNLPVLSRDAVAQLAAGSPYPVEALYALTGGNPFFVTEVLSSEGSELPPSARDAVLARAARLDPTARTALDMAAVIGGRIDPALLLSFEGISAEAVDTCCAAGLLLHDGDALRFRHEISRRAVVDAIPSLRLATTHADVLSRLMGFGEQDPARLAHHADGAGDADAVLAYAPAAAVHASVMAAHRDAAAQYQRALRFSEGCSQAQRAALYDGLADETALIDRWEESTDARVRARELWRAAGDLLREGEDLRKLCGAMWRLCRGAESRQYGSEAVEVLERLPAGHELAAAWNTAAGFAFEEDPDLGIAYTQKAQALARELDMPELLSDALNNEGFLVFYNGGDGAPQLREALDIAKRIDAETQIARSYSNLNEVLVTSRRFAEVESVYRDGLGYCEERDIPTYTTCLQGRRAISLGLQGRTREGWQLAYEVLGGSIASPVNRLTPLISAGVLGARLGEPGIWRWLDEAWELAVGVDDADWPILAGIARTEARWLDGDERQAVIELERTRPWLAHGEQWHRGEAAVWFHRFGLPADGGPLAQPYALEIAGRHADAALAWDELLSPYDAATALLFSGDIDLMRDALTRFEKLDVPVTETRARQRLRAAGVSVPLGRRATTRANAAGLTTREQDVLTLLAEDLANAEIARHLVLSERTVDHHVSAVLRKLAVNSRSAATARARELGLLSSEK